MLRSVERGAARLNRRLRSTFGRNWHEMGEETPHLQNLFSLAERLEPWVQEVRRQEGRVPLLRHENDPLFSSSREGTKEFINVFKFFPYIFIYYYKHSTTFTHD
jgi:hypothetical protein